MKVETRLEEVNGPKFSLTIPNFEPIWDIKCWRAPGLPAKITAVSGTPNLPSSTPRTQRMFWGVLDRYILTITVKFLDLEPKSWRNCFLELRKIDIWSVYLIQFGFESNFLWKTLQITLVGVVSKGLNSKFRIFELSKTQNQWSHYDLLNWFSNQNPRKWKTI